MEDKFNVIDLNRLRMPNAPGRLVVGGIVAVALLLAVLNTLYQVQPEEVGVVLRFGEFVRTTDPGLRAKLPLVEQVLKVPVQRQLKQEFGFQTAEAGARTQFVPQDRRFADEAVMLTGGPERRSRRVDRPVPGVRPLPLSLQGPATPRTPSAT